MAEIRKIRSEHPVRPERIPVGNHIEMPQKRKLGGGEQEVPAADGSGGESAVHDEGKLPQHVRLLQAALLDERVKDLKEALEDARRTVDDLRRVRSELMMDRHNLRVDMKELKRRHNARLSNQKMHFEKEKDELIAVHTEQTEEQKIELKRAKDDMQEYKTELMRMRGRIGRIGDYDLEQISCLEQELLDALVRVQKVKLLRRAEEEVVKSLDSCKCSIGHKLMRDPVVAADGHTYEREEIVQWLATSDKSPKTGLQLLNKTLTPNYAIKGTIDEAVEMKLQELQEKEKK